MLFLQNRLVENLSHLVNMILAFHRIIHKYTQGSSINLDYFSFYAELCFNTICIHKFPLRFYLLPTFKLSYFMSPHQFLSLFYWLGKGTDLNALSILSGWSSINFKSDISISQVPSVFLCQTISVKLSIL